MNKEIIALINDALVDMQMFCDSVVLEEEHGYLYLRITLDKEEGYIDLTTITEASKIINTLIDEKNFIKEKYILEIWAKEKGGNC